MSIIFTSIRNILVMTILLGVIYPLCITVIGKVTFPTRSQGSLYVSGNQVTGSELIAQKFTSAKYFWSRPSAIDYGSHSSGASQKSSSSVDLKDAYNERLKSLGGRAPNDLLWASGSGLDPHISVEAAKFQVSRIAKARNIPEEEIVRLILSNTEERFLGFMGQPRVNVLRLNRTLDNTNPR